MNNLRLAHIALTGYLLLSLCLQISKLLEKICENTAAIKMLLKDVNCCLLSSKNKSVNLTEISFIRRLWIPHTFPVGVVNNAVVWYVSLLLVVDEHILKDQVWLRMRSLLGL